MVEYWPHIYDDLTLDESRQEGRICGSTYTLFARQYEETIDTLANEFLRIS